MIILLTGGSGQLGRCLQDRCPAGWVLLVPASSTLNIGDPFAVDAYIEKARPDLVINAAAYNAVDQAEDNPAQAMTVNAQGPLHLARAAARIGARLIHISSDYVFDGAVAKPCGESDIIQSYGEGVVVRPYDEDAIASPLNAYGESKLAGEQAVLSTANSAVAVAQPGHAIPNVPSVVQPSAQRNVHSKTQHIVLRTAWLYSEYGGNFVKTMLRLAAQGQPVRVVDDQVGTPTYAGDLAQAIIQLAGLPNVPGGIYHYAGSETMSWYGFAQRIFQAAGLRPNLSAIASSAYPSRAARPRYSALSSTKLAQHGIHAKPLQQGLDYVIGRLRVL